MLRQKIKTGLVLLPAVLALLFAVGWIERVILLHTANSLTYPSDAYLNLAVAKNLAFDRVWGISRHAFESAASSPLYTTLVALVFFIMGAHLIIPLLINGAAAILLLIIFQRWLAARGLNSWQQLLSLLAAVLLIPLPPLIVSGREYALQLLCSVLFILAFSANPSSRRTLLYGMMMVSASYDSLILLLIAVIVLLWRRNWQVALRLGMVSLVPITVLGIVAMRKHGFFIPDAVLYESFPGKDLWLTLYACWFWAIRGRRGSFRMAYVFPLLMTVEALAAFRGIPPACLETYEHQYQVGNFVHRYYYKAHVASNAIGVMAYFSDGRKLDLAGVADPAVLKSKRRHSWSPEVADSLSNLQAISLTILYDSPEPVHRWNKAASWQIHDRRSAGTDSISFYISDTAEMPQLRKDLHEYEARLPAAISVRYY